MMEDSLEIPISESWETYKDALEQLVAIVDAGTSADYRALQEHRIMRIARAVMKQPTMRVVGKEGASLD